MNIPVTKVSSPELCGIALRYTELVTSECPIWKHCLQLTQHVTEHKTELRQVTSVMGVFVEHLLLSFFEQLYSLLTLPNQINNKYVKMFIVIQLHHVVLVLRVDYAQPLICIGQNIEYKRRAVFQIHLVVLAQFHHFIHQLPCLVQGPLVRRQFRRVHGIRKRAVQFRKYRRNVFLL